MTRYLPCIVLLACAPTSNDGPQGAVCRSEAQEATTGAWTVAFASEPSPIPLQQPFTLDVSLTHEGSDEAADLLADARMPTHNHGMTQQPAVIAVGSNAFTVEGMLLHMSGLWVLTLDVEDAEGQLHRASFDIDCDEG